MMFILSIVFNILFAVITYLAYDYMMRGYLINFKRFPIWVQRFISASFFVVFLVITIIIRLAIPETGDDVYVYLCCAGGAVWLAYSFIFHEICSRIEKIKNIKWKLKELNLVSSTDYPHIKAELKSWYDISATAKQIEKAQQQMREDLSKKEKE